jgi:hypothetical protein
MKYMNYLILILCSFFISNSGIAEDEREEANKTVPRVKVPLVQIIRYCARDKWVGMHEPDHCFPVRLYTRTATGEREHTIFYRQNLFNLLETGEIGLLNQSGYLLGWQCTIDKEIENLVPINIRHVLGQDMDEDISSLIFKRNVDGELIVKYTVHQRQVTTELNAKGMPYTRLSSVEKRRKVFTGFYL